MKPGDAERQTYTEPVVIWRLRRDGRNARATTVPHTLKTALLWWIDERIEGAEEFIEWDGALERAEVVREELMRDGWTDVT